MAEAFAFLSLCVSAAVLLVAYLIAQNVNRLNMRIDNLEAIAGKPGEPGYDILFIPKGKRVEQMLFIPALTEADALRQCLQQGIDPGSIRKMVKRA